MKHTIDVELPEGYKVINIKLDEEIDHTWSGSIKSVKATLYVQKIRPRRIVLEETEEKYLGNQVIEIDDIEISILTSKLWKEVKEVKSWANG